MKRVLFVAPTRHLLALVGLAFAASVGSLSAADHYYVNDHLATTTAVTDAAGEIAAIEADAFGTPVAGATQAARFTGKPYDDDIGAFVFPFRNYRSDEARWMSADPSGFPDGVNANYYACDPFREIDPMGLAQYYVTVTAGKGTETSSIFSYSVGQTTKTETATRVGGGVDTRITATAPADGGFWVQEVLFKLDGVAFSHYYEAVKLNLFAGTTTASGLTQNLGNPFNDGFVLDLNSPSQSGTATIQGWAMYYAPSSINPRTWGNNVSGVGDFYSRTSAVSGFSRSGAMYHWLKMDWHYE